jgi:tetratricopeptide (TPR) repeat protein
MRHSHFGIFLCAGLVSPAWASDTPRYEPTPAWIVPAPMPSPAADEAPLLRILDQQSRIADGAVWTYAEAAVSALSADALAHIGTINLSWQPFHGDIIIHRVDIIRDGQRIDVLKAGQKFTVIRREEKLEELEMNGELTATLQVEGLRVGDILDYAYSVTSKDPVLKGQVQVAGPALPEPIKIGFARTRLLWPTGTPIKWKAYPIGIVATESDKGGWHDLTFKLPAPKQPELPNDAPLRFHRLGVVEAASFGSWADVSRIVAPLYDPHGLIAPDSPLAQEVARIRDATTDPKKRTAAALALVQDRVRYFANGMNGGNYTPQTPARTWTLGYGDCKAKTLLLLAILDSLGIDAEPVLASIGTGDYVADRLPSLSAFNHIFVHAKIGGEDLWLDGTDRGSRIENLQDPPPFHWVLPARASGAGLIELPKRAPAMPTRIISVTIDQSAGITLPSPYHAVVTVHGSHADALRAVVAQLDKEKLQQLALLSLGGTVGPHAIAVTQKFSFDPAAATATIEVSGLTESWRWPREEHRYRYRPSSAISGINLNTDRARAAWKDIPISGGEAGHSSTTITVLLPDKGRGITLEGDQTATFDIAGRSFVRTASLADGTVVLKEEAMESGAELAPADLPAARAKLAAAGNHLVRLATTTDYIPPQRQIALAKADHKLDPLTAQFTTWIGDKPEEANRYVARGMLYESTYQWREALADLDKAVSIDASSNNLLRRAWLLKTLGDKTKSAADYKAVLALDPSSKPAMGNLGELQVDAGQKSAALEAINSQVDNSGEDKPEWLSVKASILAHAKDTDGALAALDEAIAAKPGSPGLLNERCWIKATLNVQLDTALQDCTQSIELSSHNFGALDSRALVYIRLHRLPEALADLNAGLDLNPTLAGSLFLRGLIERANGDHQHADQDLADAKMISPQIEQDYARWSIKP